MPHQRHQRSGERQPSRGARHGLRHLPRYPQGWREGQDGIRLSPDQSRLPALCLDCHDATSADLIKAHQGQPFATANCVQCHDPHQSRSPKLMQAYTHPPFAEGTVRHLPRRAEGRQGRSQRERRKSGLRDLPFRAGRENRKSESATSGSARRLHRLATIRMPARPLDSFSPIRLQPAWPATASRPTE